MGDGAGTVLAVFHWMLGALENMAVIISRSEPLVIMDSRKDWWLRLVIALFACSLAIEGEYFAVFRGCAYTGIVERVMKFHQRVVHHARQFHTGGLGCSCAEQLHIDSELQSFESAPRGLGCIFEYRIR